MKYVYISIFFIFIIMIYQFGNNNFSENIPSTNELSATQQEIKKVAIKTDTTRNLESEKTLPDTNDRNEVIPSKSTALSEDTPTPDELWDIQQKTKQAVVKTDSSNNLASSNSIAKIISSPIALSEDIPTPDELWEQQYKIDRTNDIPATLPEISIISDEQRRIEALASSNEISIETDSGTLNSDNNLNYVILADELPPIESLIDVIPFELHDLESLANKVLDKGGNEVVTTDLASPQLLEKNTGQ